VEATEEKDGYIGDTYCIDENRLIFWSLLAVTSLGLITGIAVYGRRGKEK
jgi:hypothetical protein